MKGTIIEINSRKKKLEGLATIALIALVIAVILLYVMLLRKLEIFQDTFLTTIVNHIKSNLKIFNLLGSFYVALLGGLFFIFVPMEAYYLNALRFNPTLILYIVFIIGILFSYSLDYIIGLRLSKAARKIISPKKFYSIKSYINKYGKLAIFLASAIPFFPSQQVTFILGVFRYNKTRLFVLTMAGQLLKFGALALFFGSMLK